MAKDLSTYLDNSFAYMYKNKSPNPLSQDFGENPLIFTKLQCWCRNTKLERSFLIQCDIFMPFCLSTRKEECQLILSLIKCIINN